jgi:hypothetical protein
MADAPSDPFAAAKANLRDTIKWLAAAIAGIAGIAIGSSPLTSLGSLPPTGASLWIALAALAAALLCFAKGVAIVLDLLIGDVFYLEEARDDEAMKKLVQDRRRDLLPPTFATLTDILDARETAATAMWNHRATPTAPAFVDAKARFEALIPTLSKLTSLLHLERFRGRVRDARRPLFGFTFVGALALATFAWTANPPKPAPAAATTPANAPAAK